MSNTRNDFLKLIAVLTMAIDHTGYIFSPEHPIFRCIGRIAFPIFAYYISEGYIHTSDLRKYILRLFTLGLISQIPYSLIFTDWNILFTLTLALILIWAYDKKKYVIGIGILVLSCMIPVDYGIYGVVLPLCIYAIKSKPKLLLTVLVMSVAYAIKFSFWPQICAVLGVMLIQMPIKIKVSVNKYFYYAFYPVHLVVLIVIAMIIR